MSKSSIFFILIAIVIGAIFIFISQQKNTQSQIINSPSQESTQQNSQIEQIIEEIGLQFSYPNDLTFRKEIADDYGKIRNLGFYIEKGSSDNPTYMLYGLYQFQKNATEQDLEKTKTDMDRSTIKETSIDGYKGIEGLILGPKTRYVTAILKDGKLFSVSTIPPTQENKELTDRIISTFDFK